MRGFWIWFIVACLAAIASARADGPPVNIDGTIGGEHVVLHLSQAEQDEVGRWRSLTVSPAHRKALRKRMRRVPEVLQIVTPFYDDCTCDMPVYGIWNRPFEVAVPIEARAEGPSSDEFERKRITRKEETAGRAAAAKRAPDPYLYMDIEGRLYCNGREINLDEAIRIADGLKAKDWKNDSLYVDRPPHRDPATTERIRATLAVLADYCKKKGMRFFPGRKEPEPVPPIK